VGVALALEEELEAVSVTPYQPLVNHYNTGDMRKLRTTLSQIACANASAFARSAPEHAFSIQVVVLLMKD
jgi:hypothetical protein